MSLLLDSLTCIEKTHQLDTQVSSWLVAVSMPTGGMCTVQHAATDQDSARQSSKPHVLLQPPPSMGLFA